MKRFMFCVVGLLLAGSTAICAEPQAFPKELERILADLKSPFYRGPTRDRAAQDLRRIGTNALPFLLSGVRTVDRIRATNLNAGQTRMLQLRAAFEILQHEARPILPELIADLQKGRSLGNASHAIAQIGTEEAVQALISGMTNHDQQIRTAAVSAAQHLRGNKMASAVVSALLPRLQDESVVIRTTAMTSLAVLAIEGNTVVPALLDVAEKDKEPMTRAYAVSRVAKFGVADEMTRRRLREIASNDGERRVRAAAERALQ